MQTVRKTSGFTIVELLIVIVVIGILAAIVIVSYNGIQSRAKLTVASNDLETIKKSMLLYKSSRSELPTPGDTYTVETNPSLCNGWAPILSAIKAEGVGSTLPYIDPWKHCYSYDDNDCSSGAAPGSNSWLMSAGPDGAYSTADDILVIVTNGC